MIDTEYEMKRILARGFTLVELLIVIALLGVIATIVIAAINPLEQANRASDAGMKADASQIVSAIQRYYVGAGEFPWQVTDGVTYGSSDAAFPFVMATLPDVGLCGTDCKTSGQLIMTNELQQTFLSRSFITSTASDGKLYVGKGKTAQSGVYVCWIPKSSSDRTKVIANHQVVNLASGPFSATTGLLSYDATTCTKPTDTGWTVTVPNLPTCAECVPE